MKTLAIFGLAASSFMVQAQDLIIFKNGTLQNAKVLEVGTNNVVYKKADNPDGPNYVAEKMEISVIEYANGSRDVMPYVSSNNNAAPTAPPPNYSQPGPASVMMYAPPRPRVNVVVAAPVVSPFYYGGAGCVGAYRPLVSRPARRVCVQPNYHRHGRW